MRYYSTKQKWNAIYISHSIKVYDCFFWDLILVSQFTMRYYLENPSGKRGAFAPLFACLITENKLLQGKKLNL